MSSSDMASDAAPGGDHNPPLVFDGAGRFAQKRTASEPPRIIDKSESVDERCKRMSGPDSLYKRYRTCLCVRSSVHVWTFVFEF